MPRLCFALFYILFVLTLKFWFAGDVIRAEEEWGDWDLSGVRIHDVKSPRNQYKAFNKWKDHWGEGWWILTKHFLPRTSDHSRFWICKVHNTSSSYFQNWFLFYPKPHSVLFSNSDNAISAYNDYIEVIDACMDPFFKQLIEIPEMCTQMHTGWKLSISYLL